MMMLEEMEYQVSSDASGNPLEGGKNYKFHLPPNIPASNFWSIIVYDNKSHLMIRTDQPWPSVHSQCEKLIVNQDGSVDAWFGPKAPVGSENNWIKTIPGESWHMLLRLYYPLESWFDGLWRPGEIEEVK
jgi:hypothetical protein